VAGAQGQAWPQLQQERAARHSFGSTAASACGGDTAAGAPGVARGLMSSLQESQHNSAGCHSASEGGDHTGGVVSVSTQRSGLPCGGKAAEQHTPTASSMLSTTSPGMPGGVELVMRTRLSGLSACSTLHASGAPTSAGAAASATAPASAGHVAPQGQGQQQAHSHGLQQLQQLHHQHQHQHQQAQQQAHSQALLQLLGRTSAGQAMQGPGSGVVQLLGRTSAGQAMQGPGSGVVQLLGRTSAGQAMQGPGSGGVRHVLSVPSTTDSAQEEEEGEGVGGEGGEGGFDLLPEPIVGSLEDELVLDCRALQAGHRGLPHPMRWGAPRAPNEAERMATIRALGHMDVDAGAAPELVSGG
jgi:hypothetical protein